MTTECPSRRIAGMKRVRVGGARTCWASIDYSTLCNVSNALQPSACCVSGRRLGIEPGRFDRTRHLCLSCFRKGNTSGALSAPSSACGREDPWKIVHELRLLLGGELDHRARHIGKAESGENSCINAKVGMSVMSVLLAAGEAQHQSTKSFSGHSSVARFGLY
jgi:hypothetical protein